MWFDSPGASFIGEVSLSSQDGNNDAPKQYVKPQSSPIERQNVNFSAQDSNLPPFPCALYWEDFALTWIVFHGDLARWRLRRHAVYSFPHCCWTWAHQVTSLCKYNQNVPYVQESCFCTKQNFVSGSIRFVVSGQETKHYFFLPSLFSLFSSFPLLFQGQFTLDTKWNTSRTEWTNCRAFQW